FLLFISISGAYAQGGSNAAAKTSIEIRIGYLRAFEAELALSVLDIPPVNAGVAGAEVGIADNNTNGSFLGQKFTLDVVHIKPDEDAVEPFNQMVQSGVKFVLADLSAEQLLAIADAGREKGIIISNVAAREDALRE